MPFGQGFKPVLEYLAGLAVVAIAVVFIWRVSILRSDFRREWFEIRKLRERGQVRKANRNRLLESQHCPNCDAALNKHRLHDATKQGNPEPAQWLYRCPCGRWTLYDADGTCLPIENQSGRFVEKG